MTLMQQSTLLTPGERRQVGIAALTAAVVTLATGLVSWGLEEIRHAVTEKRRVDAVSQPSVRG